MSGEKGRKLCYCKADRVVGLKVGCCCHLLPKQMRERMEQEERRLGEAKDTVLETTTRLFVYGITETVLAHELAAVFRRFGPVVEATNTGRGFGFVTMESKDGADRAVREVTGQRLFGGGRVRVETAKPKKKLKYHQDQHI